MNATTPLPFVDCGQLYGTKDDRCIAVTGPAPPAPTTMTWQQARHITEQDLPVATRWGPQLWAGPTQRVFLEDGHFNIRCGDVGGCQFVAK